MRTARIPATGGAMSTIEGQDSILGNPDAETSRTSQGISGTANPSAPDGSGSGSPVERRQSRLPFLEDIMNLPISRRNVAIPAVGAIAAMSASVAAMAEEAEDRRWRELDHQQNDASLTAVGALILAHAEAYEREAVEWNKVADIEEGEAMKEYVVARVQIGRLLQGVDDDGERIYSPVYAYSDEDIERRLEPHLSARLSMCGTCEKRKQEVRAHFDELTSAKKVSLAAAQTEADRIEEQSGYAAAKRRAEAASKVVADIEDAIVNFVPVTIRAAAKQAAWVFSVFSGEGPGYIGEDELAKAMKSIGSAMSQGKSI